MQSLKELAKLQTLKKLDLDGNPLVGVLILQLRGLNASQEFKRFVYDSKEVPGTQVCSNQARALPKRSAAPVRGVCRLQAGLHQHLGFLGTFASSFRMIRRLQVSRPHDEETAIRLEASYPAPSVWGV